MAFNWKKGLKVTLTTILALVVVVLVVLGIAINFVLTPERITPQITRLANQSISGELATSKVEFAFFSTFPDLSVEIENVLINDPGGDTLLSLAGASIALDPISALTSGQIIFDHIHLNRPHIIGRVNEEGEANWDILILESTEEPEESSELILGINDIRITDGAISHQDLTSGISTSLSAFNFKGLVNYQGVNDDNIVSMTIDELGLGGLTANMTDSASTFEVLMEQLGASGELNYQGNILTSDLNLAMDHILLIIDNQNLLNPMPLHLTGRSSVDLDQTLVNLDSIYLDAGDQDLIINTSGWVRVDSTGPIEMNLQSGVQVANIDNVIGRLPDHYYDFESFTAKGEIDLTTAVKGVYSDSDYPIVDLILAFNNASFAYRDLPNKLDFLETVLEARVDYSGKTPSDLNIRKLEVHSEGLELESNGTITNALGNARIELQNKGSVDFEQLLVTLPIEDIVASGSVEFNVKSGFFLEDLETYDFGNIDASGRMDLNNIYTRLSDTLEFSTESSVVRFGQGSGADNADPRRLRGRLVFNKARLTIEDQVNFTANRINALVNTIPPRDSLQIVPVNATLKLTKSRFVLGDSINGKMGKMDGTFALMSAARDPSIPRIESKLLVNNLEFEQDDTYGGVRNLEYDFEVEKANEKRWPVVGSLKWTKLFAFTPLFPKQINIRNTHLDFQPGTLTLNSATLRIGNSELGITGTVYDLQRSIVSRKSLRAELSIEADTININQLTRILNRGVAYQEGQSMSSIDTTTAEDVEMETFVVPKRLDFDLNVNVKNAHYGDLELDNISGKILIKDQVINLDHLHMTTNAAHMETSARYVARHKRRARANFDIKLTELSINKMVSILPFLDTLLPMTKDFEGMVNMGIQGRALIGKNMEINQSSLSAIARIEGKDMVLLDGETFQYLAKTLKFKNREKNTLDTLAVEMAIEDGAMEIFPSLVTMDRYRVAVGGTQNLDLTYKYHISVLKSPLPFKTGIDIFGDPEDYEYKVTKAKYKYLFSDKDKHEGKADEDLVNKKEEILKKISFP